MSLKIIGTGYGRTGTLSTYTALKQLGYPCYHMFEVIENKENKDHLDFWNKVAEAPAGVQHDWEKVLANYTAVVDNPTCCVWRELMEAYPDAKVLHTLHPRGAEGWYESTIDTIYFTENNWQFRFLALFAPFPKKMGNMCRKLIWQRSHRNTMENKQAAIALYHAHLEEVKAAVPADRLLVFSVDQGWEPLCNFLGEPVPDMPFPNVNDRAAIKKTIADITKGAYVFIFLGILLLCAIVYGVMAIL